MGVRKLWGAIVASPQAALFTLHSKGYTVLGVPGRDL